MPDHDQQLNWCNNWQSCGFEPRGAGVRSFVLAAIGLCCVAMVAACSDGGSSRSVMSWSNVALLELLPEGTSTILAVDVAALDAESASADLGLLLQPGRDADPLLRAVATAIDSASAGLDPAKDFSNFVLAYLLNSEPSALLLADSKENQIRKLFESQDVEQLEDYRGTTLYLVLQSNRVVAMLPDGVLCIGIESAVKSVIDRIRNGDGDGDAGGADSRLTRGTGQGVRASTHCICHDDGHEATTLENLSLAPPPLNRRRCWPVAFLLPPGNYRERCDSSCLEPMRLSAGSTNWQRITRRPVSRRLTIRRSSCSWRSIWRKPCQPVLTEATELWHGGRCLRGRYRCRRQ